MATSETDLTFVVVCPDCNEDLPVDPGVPIDDLFVLHGRRCEASLYPEIRVSCTDCGDDLELAHGVEVELWMHAAECRAAQLEDLDAA